ncbi:MAG: amino acid--tRNA ligase-related protein, partial [Nanoarchaeota archaeon]
MSDLEYFVGIDDQEHLRAYSDMVVRGELPYPPDMQRTTTINTLKKHRIQGEFKIAGRVLDVKTSGKTTTFELYDGSDRVLVETESIPGALQRGDIVEVSSDSYNGAVSSSNVRLITKSLAHLPTMQEFEEKEDEYRKKHRDIEMIVNHSLKDTFVKRSRINSLIRRFYGDREFIDVETPFLLPYPEISPNKAFSTEEPKFSQKADLRRTNTEYIRRLMVAGFEKVYQLGKCFRDEPTSFKHLPEFTQLTFGIAYEDYNALMKNIEELTSMLCMDINGHHSVNFRGQTLDFTLPWKRISVRNALLQHTGIDIEKFDNPKELSREAQRAGLEVPREYKYGGFLKMAILVDKLIEDNVNNKLVQPTFLCEYPWYLGGPAK